MTVQWLPHLSAQIPRALSSLTINNNMSTDKINIADNYIIAGKLWSQVPAPPSKMWSEIWLSL